MHIHKYVYMYMWLLNQGFSPAVARFNNIYVSGHQFFHKWAAILDPRDIGAGPKGYIKCDIVICGQGAITKVTSKSWFAVYLEREAVFLVIRMCIEY